MATNPPNRRPVWFPIALGAIQFAAVMCVLFYVAPFDTTKSGAAGLIVFLIALVVALVFGWGW